MVEVKSCNYTFYDAEDNLLISPLFPPLAKGGLPSAVTHHKKTGDAMSYVPGYNQSLTALSQNRRQVFVGR